MTPYEESETMRSMTEQRSDDSRWDRPSKGARKRLGERTCECRRPRQVMSVAGGELCAVCYRPFGSETLAKLRRATKRAFAFVRKGRQS